MHAVMVPPSQISVAPAIAEPSVNGSRYHALLALLGQILASNDAFSAGLMPRLCMCVVNERSFEGDRYMNNVQKYIQWLHVSVEMGGL